MASKRGWTDEMDERRVSQMGACQTQPSKSGVQTSDAVSTVATTVSVSLQARGVGTNVGSDCHCARLADTVQYAGCRSRAPRGPASLSFMHQPARGHTATRPGLDSRSFSFYYLPPPFLLSFPPFFSPSPPHPTPPPLFSSSRPPASTLSSLLYTPGE